MPGGVPYSPEDDDVIRQCYEQHHGRAGWARAASKILGRSSGTISQRWMAIRQREAIDAWHFRRGYVGGTQGAEAFVWKRTGGLRAHLYHTAA
jgi:hypothetical protein